VTTYKSRADWGARLRRGYVSFPTGRPIGVACHWPGTTTKFRGVSAAAIASALRGWQNFHMDVRGWSDIAYGVGIDWAGRVWELRGIHVRTAANGSTESNRDYTAALWILGIGEQPTEAQTQAFRDWRSSRLLVVHPQAAAVKTHNDVRLSPTECPGSAVTALVRSGTLLRPGDTDIAKDWYSMATEADLRNALRAELAHLPADFSAAVLTALGTTVEWQSAGIRRRAEELGWADVSLRKAVEYILGAANLDADNSLRALADKLDACIAELAAVKALVTPPEPELPA